MSGKRERVGLPAGASTEGRDGRWTGARAAPLVRFRELARVSAASIPVMSALSRMACISSSHVGARPV